MLVDFKVCHTSSVRNVHFLTAARVLELHRTQKNIFDFLTILTTLMVKGFNSLHVKSRNKTYLLSR